MNEINFINNYIDIVIEKLNKYNVANEVIESKKIILETKKNNGKLIFAGNGASASISNHASLDFTKQAKVTSINFNESAFICNTF